MVLDVGGIVLFFSFFCAFNVLPCGLWLGIFLQVYLDYCFNDHYVKIKHSDTTNSLGTIMVPNTYIYNYRQYYHNKLLN